MRSGHTYTSSTAAPFLPLDLPFSAAVNPAPPMRVVSLFSGCGGLDLGLQLAGHEIILQVPWPPCQAPDVLPSSAFGAIRPISNDITSLSIQLYPSRNARTIRTRKRSCETASQLSPSSPTSGTSSSCPGRQRSSRRDFHASTCPGAALPPPSDPCLGPALAQRRWRLLGLTLPLPPGPRNGNRQGVSGPDTGKSTPCDIHNGVGV